MFFLITCSFVSSYGCITLYVLGKKCDHAAILLLNFLLGDLALLFFVLLVGQVVRRNGLSE